MPFPGSTTYPGVATYPGPTSPAIPTGDPPTSTHPTVVATPEPFNFPPRVRIDLTNFGAVATAQITRVDSFFGITPVRDGDPTPVSAGTITLYDYAFPWNTPLTYRALAAGLGASNLVSADPTILYYSGGVLVHDGIPTLSVRANAILDEGEEIYPDEPAGVWASGRETPKTTTDGTLKAPSQVKTFWTETAAQERAMRAIFAGRATLLWQMADPIGTTTGGTIPAALPLDLGGSPIGDIDTQVCRWVTPRLQRVSRVGQAFASQWREFTVTLQYADRPIGAQVAERTLQTIADEVFTLDDLADRYTTLRGLLLGIPGI
jgi:hypothetical protein